MDNKLCIFSYNPGGFNTDKQLFCSKLLMSSVSSTVILCNQENFLLKANGYIIRQALPDYHILFKPAEKECLEGRPKNGMFIAIPEIMRENVTDISPNHWRIQAAIIRTNKMKLLIINSYFPQDSKSPINIDSELEEIIAAINNLLMNYQFADVIWMGDINADFCRNTKQVWRIETYLNDTKLVKAWDSFQIDFTHEFEKDKTTFTCCIDHFFWNEKLSNKVLESGVLHLPDNLSDHSPIYCKIDYNCAGEKEEQTPLNCDNRSSKITWKRLTPSQKDVINHNIEERMLNVQIPYWGMQNYSLSR